MVGRLLVRLKYWRYRRRIIRMRESLDMARIDISSATDEEIESEFLVLQQRLRQAELELDLIRKRMKQKTKDGVYGTVERHDRD